MSQYSFDQDSKLLEKFGYKQNLNRSMKGFSSFAISSNSLPGKPRITMTELSPPKTVKDLKTTTHIENYQKFEINT